MFKRKPALKVHAKLWRIELSESMVEVLSSPVYIPVISDILSSFGVTLPSILDVICWIGAVPATIIYKAIYNKAPFADDEDTKLLTTTTNWDVILAAVPATAQVTSNSPAAPKTLAAPTIQSPAASAQVLVAIHTDSGSATTSNSTCAKMFYMGQLVGGVLGIPYTCINAADAACSERKNSSATIATGLSICSAALIAVANRVEPHDPSQNTVFKGVKDIVSVLKISNKIAWWYARQRTNNPATINVYYALGTVLDMYLTFPAILCSVEHFIELAGDVSSMPKTIGILDECSNVTSCLGRILYAFVTLPPGMPELIPFLIVANIGSAGLHIAETLTED